VEGLYIWKWYLEKVIVTFMYLNFKSLYCVTNGAADINEMKGRG
jgi:hypothetical protein